MIACTFENGDKASLRHVVIDALVLKDGKILLVKRTKKLLEGGKWALVGGFMERDETIRETLSREVHEETGWTLTDIQLFRINDGPRRNEDRQNISFIFTCTGLKKTGDADWESDEQRWFDLDNLPPAETIAFDHLDSIQLYKDYLIKPRTLPIEG